MTASQPSPPGKTTLTAAPIDVKWQSTKRVNVAEVRTFGCGVGSEYVYCYSYPAYRRIAVDSGELRYRIKVGKAESDPVARISQQVAGNQTAVAELPVVLLIFQSLAASHLERWLHKRLERVADSIGSEWFNTNEDELLSLYCDYLADATRAIDQESTSQQLLPNGSHRNDARRQSAPETRNEQGHRIQAAMKLGVAIHLSEVMQLTGLSESRVLNHVNYEIRMGRAEMNADGYVTVLEHPTYRTPGIVLD